MCDKCTMLPNLDRSLGEKHGFCRTLYHPFYGEDGWVCCQCHTWNRLERTECRRDLCKHVRCK